MFDKFSLTEKCSLQIVLIRMIFKDMYKSLLHVHKNLSPKTLQKVSVETAFNNNHPDIINKQPCFICFLKDTPPSRCVSESWPVLTC